MQYLMESSGIPYKKQRPKKLEAGNDFDAFVQLANLKDNVAEFVEYGDNLYIMSEETGNGKTTWAIKLMLKYFDCIWAGNGFKQRGLFVHVPTFLNQLKNFGDSTIDDLKESINTVDLVIWDDIASNGMSQYDHSQLLSFIDQRILKEQANIFTGNLTSINALEKVVGNRLASRIWNSSQIVQFNGKDRR